MTGDHMPTEKGEKFGFRWVVKETINDDTKYRGLLSTYNAQDKIKENLDIILSKKKQDMS